MKNRRWKNPIVWSSLFFIVQLVLTFLYSNFYYSILIVLVTLFSIIYHLSHEKRYFLYDSLFALALIVKNLYSFSIRGFSSEYFKYTLIFVFIAFLFYYKSLRKNYSINHAMWHLTSSVITIIAILSVNNS